MKISLTLALTICYSITVDHLEKDFFEDFLIGLIGLCLRLGRSSTTSTITTISMNRKIRISYKAMCSKAADWSSLSLTDSF